MLQSATNIALLLLCYASIWFVIGMLRKRNDVADIAWGLGFILLSWVSFYLSKDFTLRGLLASGLVSLWGLRLAWHIHRRNTGKPEDSRYLEWRKSWGKWFYLRSYFQIYLLQGSLLFLISLPIIFINHSTGHSLNYLDLIGFLI